MGSRSQVGENRPGGFEKAIEEAIKISHSPEAKDLPGYGP